MSAYEHEPTLGEIMRRLDELSLEVKAIPLRFEESFVRRDVYRSDLERVQIALDHLTTRIEKEEDRTEWVTRTVGGMIIAAVLGVAFWIGAN